MIYLIDHQLLIDRRAKLIRIQHFQRNDSDMSKDYVISGLNSIYRYKSRREMDLTPDLYNVYVYHQGNKEKDQPKDEDGWSLA